MIGILDMLSEEKCFEMIREVRWDDGVRCPWCESIEVKRNGHVSSHIFCQKYKCKACGKYFDDLTSTVLSDSNLPTKTWVLCLYLMGLNQSNSQIASELGLRRTTAQEMTSLLREEIQRKSPEPVLSGAVEMDEVYIVSGHKGRPDIVRRKMRLGRRNRLRGARGRGTLLTEKPPIFGLLQRDGSLLMRMLPNVRRTSIDPIIRQFVEIGTTVYTDEYDIYSHLPSLGYRHLTVCHGRREYARDADGDGIREVHVNSIEGVWSLLRSWLRPHRGISQEKLPCYLAFFQFVHNARVRGKSLLLPLMKLLLT